MGAFPFLAAALVALLTLPLAGRAQPFQSAALGEQEIGIDAEEISYDQKTNTVVARGAVVITRGETELRADEVRLNRSTNEAEARGHVRITDSEGSICAETVQLNLDDETGFLEQAEVQSRRLRYSLRGDRMQKGLGQSYHIENGRFTTCRCPEGPPSWSISGADLQIDLAGYAELRGGTFNVLDTAILYVPRALFPVQRDRQSGFLTPRFGASNRRGFQALVPFYWAISKSQDATLGFDIETSARAGLVGEYRYALSRDIRGRVDASYFNESFRGEAATTSFETTIPEDRWSVVAEHDQPAIGTSRGYADVFVISDDLFLRDVNTYAFEHTHDIAIRTLPFTESRAGVIQMGQRYMVNGDGTYYQNLLGTDSQTLQRAGEVSVVGQEILGDHILGDVVASAVDFQRGSGVDGLRLDVAPRATVPLPLGRFAFGAVGASVRETAYHLFEQTLDENGQVLPPDQSRELVQLDAEAGTTFSRVYPFHWLQLEKVKHTLEPTLAYLYIPAVSQENLPLFDGVDRINRRNLLTYGLVTRLIGKFSDLPSDGRDTVHIQAPSSVRELGRLSLMQSFDISRELQPLQTGRAADHFSDVDLDGRVNPSRILSFRFHTNYDTTNNSISAARVGFFVEDPRTDTAAADAPRLGTRTSAGISYRFLTQNLLQEIDDNVVIRLRDWIGFFYSSRYDVVANHFLDNFFGLRLTSTCDCWALDFAVTDRSNPQELEVRAQLTLAGLGSSRSERRAATP